MKRIFALAMLALLFVPATSAFAQVTGTEAALVSAEVTEGIAQGLGVLGIGIGLGLIIIGAGKGIGNIGGHAADAIARQPEAGGRIFTTMIISAALIEGVTLFALVVAIIK